MQLSAGMQWYDVMGSNEKRETNVGIRTDLERRLYPKGAVRTPSGTP